MKIQSINNTNFGGSIKILCSENKHIPFLYNDLQKISRDNKLATNFRTREVVFPSISEKIIEQIKKMGIIVTK